MIVRSSLLTTWFAIAVVVVLVGLPSRAIADEPLPPRIQERHEGPFPHQVWTHHWATFSERARVAARLGYSVEQFDGLVKQHGWLLQSPPALRPPDDVLRRAARFGGGKKTRLAVTDFIADEEGTTPAVETRVEVLADDAELRLEFRCAEAAANPLLTRASHPTDDFHRLVLDGDVHKLYQLRRGIQTQTLLERIAAAWEHLHPLLSRGAVWGLDPWQPAELYTSAEWYNQAFGLRPGTHVVIPRDGNSLRLGSTRLEAVRRSAACWEGLMDRATAVPRGWMARRQVHLVHRARNHEGLSRTERELEICELPSN